MKKIILFVLIIIVFKNTYAWTSSNEGIAYTMEMIDQETEYISFNNTTSQYEIWCDIEILENDTLIINPGENLKFCNAKNEGKSTSYGMEIYGTFLAIGTKEQPIFLGDPEYDFDNGEYWDGIKFFDTSPNGESIMKYCYLRGTNTPAMEYAIKCYNSSPIIDHCNISYMWSIRETGGGAAINCRDESYPIISYCNFDILKVCVAVMCRVFVDTVYYPSPLMYGCNIMPGVHSFWGAGCDYDKVVINGGFLDNCYLGFGNNDADTTLGEPIDTIGDGICSTTSTNWFPRFMNVDGIVNPRSTPNVVGVNEIEIDILPTTTKYLVLNKNYPNPFKEQTTIDFEIRKNNIPVSILIYDYKGQVVNKIIENKTYNKGNYSIIWKGDDYCGTKVPSGIYFYKLLSDNQMQVKKAIVVK